ncbi:MAG: amidohydrolase family protein [Pseudomonadota bacterium]
MPRSLVAILSILLAAPAFAQEGEAPPQPDPKAETSSADEKEEEEKWDVNAPPMETTTFTIDVDEGTWMSVDVSPDGQTIAFDMLGDLYTLPIAGGTATNISSGLAYDYHPRFSPDGAHIAFTSDRAGGDNIWIMKPDGSDKRQVTKETFRLLNNPTWSPDGRYIAAKKHFTTGRSLGTGEIWMYHLGGGDGIKLVARPNEQHQKELGEPIFSPDGKAIYFTRNVSPGGTFIYAQDSNQSLFEIEKYDLATGERTTAVSGPGGSVRPAPSPDGKMIAFVRRERGKSKLYVKDLNSGAERKIYDALDQDMQETWGVQGLYPNMDWTPDSASIVFWAGGKIWRVDVADGAASEIPFRVTDTRAVVDPPRPQIDVAPDTFETKMPRFAAVSPNGRQVVFESLGKLYIKALPNGAPRRLTRGAVDEFQLFPSWSRDGTKIVFVGWNDETLGTIRTVSNTGGAMRAVTAEPGHYRRPRFSPDGATIVFEKGSGGYLTSGEWSETTGVYRVAASGGREISRVTASGAHPHFGADNDRIFMTKSGDGKQMLVSVDLNGEAEREHASADLVTEYQVSPSGAHAAFREDYAAYVMPLAPGPQKIGAGKGGKAAPVVKASGDGALYIHWSGGGDALHWSLGPTLYSAATDDLIPALPKAEDDESEGYEAPTDGVSLARTIAADKPDGVVAITGARIITMTGADGGVIEDGTIVIEDNRITAVGADVAVPAGAKTVDAAGKTIIPGLIDAHAHGAQGQGDIIPQQNWLAIAHLAFGVTTVHDPSNVASHIFAAAEMQRAGDYLAPRIYSTGEIVYGAKAPGYFADINDIDDARAHVKRLKAQGAHSIKNYNQPRRDQRQQVVAAAKEEGIAVVPEGGSLFHMDMSLIADGNTTVEHNIPQAKLYEDVLSFYAASGVAYTPTLVVTYGGLAGDPYWRYKTDVWTHPLLSKHVPPHVLQPKSVRSTKAPEEDFADQYAAAAAKDLADRGVKVSIGAHGQEEGLAAHWEIWSFARGGMSPLEALRTATTSPAAALGFDKDIGTLEPGKLADLVILNENPLKDIRNTDKIDRVMLNGRLYDAITMNEVVTGDAVRKPYYWE